jgi:hypothetical protein
MPRLAARAARAIALVWAIAGPLVVHAAGIPRPEHPRPDAVRSHWLNLNGPWEFRFDPRDEGLNARWFEPGASGFDRTITVPFPWESELSGIQELNGPKVAWYRRVFEVPADFPKDGRTWLRFEAVDWRADVWVNGKKVAEHEGGYSPFEADITDAITRGKPAVVVVRAFDPTDPELPAGKQVGWYTPTSGIWQTVWLESRARGYLADFTIKTAPDLDAATVDVVVRGVPGPAGQYVVAARSSDPNVAPAESTFTFGAVAADSPKPLTLKVRDPKLWTPETPHLYDLTLELRGPGGVIDTVTTYFGLRTIARGKYGDAPYERILLNGKPIYLRAALDQSFNPKGIYTAPDDDFLRRDLMIAKYHNLNGLRIHIKPDEPRRLYWADKLGLLILEDMPNTWRQTPRARAAWEATMREVVARDKNHPGIIAWIAFNETWGLGSPDEYKANKDTQAWVKRMVADIRTLDPTRLVEDNSPCNFDHVEGSDLNSWHFYIDDHRGAARHIADVVAQTRPGSSWNFCPGEHQSTAPLINSEYGGVSAGGGDRDISWSFRDLTTLLRRQPKIQGYVYTELTDIEWEHNGFFNYDRTPKHFGYEAFLPDMHVNELQGADFVGYDAPPAIVAKPGETITVPVFVSHFSDRDFEPKLRWWLDGYDDRTDMVMASSPQSVPATWKLYDVTEQPPIRVRVPDRPFVGALNLTLRDPENHRFAANFVNVVVRPEKPLPRTEVDPQDSHDTILRFSPEDVAKQSWTRTGSPPAGKVYGFGMGYIEYHIKVPPAVVRAGIETVRLQFEIASKAEREKVDWPSRKNRQDYPQTDDRKWPSMLEISLNGDVIHREELEDDPADAKGVLSHLARVEHGSYGELIEAQVPLSGAARAAVEAGRPLVIRLAVPESAPHAGGLCLFGSETGRYPFDPTVILHTRDPLPANLGVAPDAPVTTDVAAPTSIPLVAAGDATRARPARWAYTTEEPPAGWDAPGFDDSSWRRGEAGFGTEGTPGVRVRTEWNSPRIWLRTTFEAPAIGAGDTVRLHLFHDEDVEVRLNGTRIFRASGYVTDYLDVALDDAARALLRPGANTLAVSCRQTGGGQGVDVGLVLSRASD